MPTVVCGPGDIAQAHQPNEFILAIQIDACEGFMGRMTEWATPGLTMRLIAVDWGTTSLRGALLDAQGGVLEEKSAPLGILNAPSAKRTKNRYSAVTTNYCHCAVRF